MYAKAGMFILIGVTSFAFVIVENPSIKVAVLLLLTIWAFCRAYYFAFYVIEKYIDPQQRFSGLLAFLRYVIRKRRRKAQQPPGGDVPKAAREEQRSIGAS